jgi:hypothetical protein
VGNPAPADEAPAAQADPGPRRRPSPGRPRLLRRLRHQMTSNRSMGESGTYVCNGRMRGADCPGVAINREALEHFIRDVVAGSLDSPEVMELQTERLNQAAEGSMSSELSELHEQADALGDSILILQAQINTAPASAMSALLNRIGEEEALKGQIEMRISEKTEGRPRAIPDISGAEFLELSETEQKSIIRAFLRKAVVYADDGSAGRSRGCSAPRART